MQEAVEFVENAMFILMLLTSTLIYFYIEKTTIWLVKF